MPTGSVTEQRFCATGSVVAHFAQNFPTGAPLGRASLVEHPTIVQRLQFVRATIVLILVLGTAIDAFAQQATVHVDCQALEQETVDAFEARARAELAVRQADGQLDLRCIDTNDVQLSWAVAGHPLHAQSVPQKGVSADTLFEVFLQLLGPADATPTTQPERENTPPKEATTSADQPLLSEQPPPPASAPEEAPALKKPTVEGDPPQPTVVPGGIPSPSIRWSVGAVGAWWGEQVALGAELSTAIRVLPAAALSASAALLQAVVGVEEFTTRNFFGTAGIRFQPARGLGLSLALLGGGTQIQAPENYRLIQGGEEPWCNLATGDGGGVCGFVGAQGEIAYEIGSGAWRPEIAAQVQWGRQFRAHADSEMLGETRSISIPSVRPGVVLRLVWVPAPREHEQ